MSVASLVFMPVGKGKIGVDLFFLNEGQRNMGNNGTSLYLDCRSGYILKAFFRTVY